MSKFKYSVEENLTKPLRKLREQKIGRRTRASKNGSLIVCPDCDGQTRVYHFAWGAIVCRHCDLVVSKHQWKKVVYRD